MIYPFITVFERGLGVSTQAISWALALRSATGALAPLLGSLADRYGRKAGMISGLVLFTCGVGLLSIWPTFPIFVAMLLFTFTGGAIFIPALQAYLGDSVPYDQRGAVLGISEVGWSLSFILGVPTIGWIIAKQDWYAPFPWLTAAGFLAILILVVILPKDSIPKTQRANLLQSMGLILKTPVAVAGITISLSIAASNELVNLVFGLWLYDAFELKITALALASMVIGFSELGGELLVSLVVDRLGKARSVAAGLILNALAVIFLPIIGQSINGALFGLFLLYLTFEFTIVSCIPLITELLPGARATLIANFFTSIALGRAIGAFIAPFLYQLGFSPNTAPSLVPISITAALLNLFALFMLRILKGR
jgi:predicted MFS family arabinose efflux permease